MHPVVEETAKQIKELKIQGAKRIAERAVAAIYALLLDEPKDVEKEVVDAVKVLVKTRPTEPALRDAMAFVLRELRKGKDLPPPERIRQLKRSLENYAEHMKEVDAAIGRIGARLIEDGYTVITHCHSSTLMRVFEEASKEKKFTVIVTETRPRYQGKITAKELLGMGVDVMYIVDGAAHYFMKDVDLYMTGADVITADGRVINKIGTALMAVSAREMGVPYYVAASTYKFDPATILGYKEPIEERDPKEVIDPKELPGAKIRNPAFDVTPPRYITGIVSELGVLTPHAFVSTLSQQKHIDRALEEIIRLSFG